MRSVATTGLRFAARTQSGCQLALGERSPGATRAPVRTSQRAAAISVIVFAAIESPEIEPFEIATSA
ncbi:MAG TPA: hypothetical protein VJ860_24085, partial [Polyangia bacterium]|nr:hypothetical protein [Polyangia bacterium]